MLVAHFIILSFAEWSSSITELGFKAFAASASSVAGQVLAGLLPFNNNK